MASADIRTGLFRVNEKFLDEIGALDAWKKTDLTPHTLPNDILQNGYMEVTALSGKVQVKLLHADGTTPYQTSNGLDGVGALDKSKAAASQKKHEADLKRELPPHKRGYYMLESGQHVYLDGKGDIQFYNEKALSDNKWGNNLVFIDINATDIEMENDLYIDLNKKIAAGPLAKRPDGLPPANGAKYDILNTAKDKAEDGLDVVKATAASYRLGDVLKPGILYVQAQGDQKSDDAMQAPNAIFYRLASNNQVEFCGKGLEAQWQPMDAADFVKDVAPNGQFVAVKPELAAKHGFDMELDKFKGGMKSWAQKTASTVAEQAMHNPTFVTGAAVVGIGALVQMAVGAIKSKVDNVAEKKPDGIGKKVLHGIGTLLTYVGLGAIAADAVIRGINAAHPEKTPVNEGIENTLRSGIQRIAGVANITVDPRVLAPQQAKGMGA